MMDGSEEGIPAKKSKKSCKYLEKWDSEFTFLKKSRMGHSHAFCKICSCDFSVSHGGRNDVSQHEKSTKHKRWLEAQKHAQTMSAFVTRNTTEADQVINAEVKMAMLCAKNNVSFTFCDDFNKCVAEMFPDSAIARKYSAGKTKSTQLIKGAIAAELDEELARTCRSQPFSLMCDESNNRKTDKEFVILTRLYDEATLQVATKFMEMPICNVGNAENLYEKLSEALRKRGIPWENLIAFNSDNASVMKGRHNSVISRLKTSQPHVQDLGCICHLAQLATGCAIKAAQVPVEDFLVGIYTHFDKSAKRCEIYKEFVDFTDSDHLKLLRYCSTRWLSLLTCVQRVLNQWDALQAYFNSHEEVERSAKIHDLASHLRDPVMKIYFMFLTAALKPLSDFNIAFQSEGVQIHRLEEEMCRLIRRILGYLIPARAIVGIPLREVEYGQGHQLADEELFIGADTKAFMKSVELPMSTEKKIFHFLLLRCCRSVRRFYEAALQKMFSSFPLDHPLLRDLKVLDPAARLDIPPGAVERLGAMFPQLSLSEDRLREELIDYQVTDSKQLPQEDNIDRFWGLLGKDVRFSELPRLMKALLCIPHSNASSERVFSMVRKIVTENRMSLDNSTVCALLSCKINHSGPAYKYTPSKKVLKNAKSATHLYNKSLVNVREPHE
ncbi:uncharacterized protein [Nothobranchius furzeri]|uniref:uncharacterized protein isoform X1 n=1 Tax=Nothobranchius furzeri TaxID=105023 RepID=UPI003904AE43